MALLVRYFLDPSTALSSLINKFWVSPHGTVRFFHGERAQQDLLGAVRFLQGDKDGHQLPGQSWLLLIGDCAEAWDALSDTSLE